MYYRTGRSLAAGEQRFEGSVAVVCASTDGVRPRAKASIELGPPYVRIAAGLRGMIERGELLPGARLPSTRQLARDAGVALATASKALSLLRDDGVVRAIPRVGTV